MRSYLSAGDCDEIAQVIFSAWWPSIRLLPGVHAISCALATMISLETSASFLGVKNTGASTHRDNKLQLTASGLSELLPDFSGKDIFVSISVNSLCLRELIKYMISIMRNNITISPPITTKRSVSILLLYR